jgi:molybdate transport system regulatory protein
MDDSSSSVFFEVSESIKYLDTAKLEELEQAFRTWVQKTNNSRFRFSRRRLFLVFLLIRYAGIKLGEALGLNETDDVDLLNAQLRLSKRSTGTQRVLPLPKRVIEEFVEIMSDERFDRHRGMLLSLDQGYVRSKFYQFAEGVGLPKEMGSPAVIRKSRGVELLRGGMPLPVVQKVLGHSTPALTAEYLDFNEEEVQRAVRHFMTRETRRKTSARNTFYGKVKRIDKGDIQSMVSLLSIGGHEVSVVITNSSLTRLGLREGSFVTALIKAPWVLVSRERESGASSMNCYQGMVSSIVNGALSSEVMVRLDDGTELCAVITEESRQVLDFRTGERAWAFFSEFSAILSVE